MLEIKTGLAQLQQAKRVNGWAGRSLAPQVDLMPRRGSVAASHHDQPHGLGKRLPVDVRSETE